MKTKLLLKTFLFLLVYEGSPRVEGDDDEEDIDDLEHEFNMDDEKNNKQIVPQENRHITEAMLYGKMSYGRGPEEGEHNPPQFPPIITGARSRPVSTKPEFWNQQNYIIRKLVALIDCRI